MDELDACKFRDIFEEMFKPKEPSLGEAIAPLTDDEVEFIDRVSHEQEALDASFRVALDEHRKATERLLYKRKTMWAALRRRIGEELWPKGLDVIANTDTRHIHKRS